MENAIVILILALILWVALRSAAKRFKKGGSCCGSGSSVIIPQKKLEGQKLGELTLSISGMHCEHCVLSVTKAINSIDGAAASVSLNQKRAVVAYDREIDREVLKKVIEDQGFEVVEIQG